MSQGNPERFEFNVRQETDYAREEWFVSNDESYHTYTDSPRITYTDPPRAEQPFDGADLDARLQHDVSFKDDATIRDPLGIGKG